MADRPDGAETADLLDYGRLGRLALVKAKAQKISGMCDVFAFGTGHRRAKQIIRREANAILAIADGLPDIDDPDGGQGVGVGHGCRR